MRTAVCVLALGLAMACPAGAESAVRYQGETPQGEPLRLKRNSTEVLGFSIRWKVQCKELGEPLTVTTSFDASRKGTPREPIDEGGRFDVVGNPDTVPYKRYKAKIFTRLGGTFFDRHAKGSLKGKIEMRNARGKLVDTCRRTLEWRIPRVKRG